MARRLEWDWRFSSLSFCWFSGVFEPCATQISSGAMAGGWRLDQLKFRHRRHRKPSAGIRPRG